MECDQREMLKKAYPSYGPDWDAAIDWGIDVSLLQQNLELTPTERLEQLQHMIDFIEDLRRARGVNAPKER